MSDDETEQPHSAGETAAGGEDEPVPPSDDTDPVGSDHETEPAQQGQDTDPVESDHETEPAQQGQDTDPVESHHETGGAQSTRGQGTDSAGKVKPGHDEQFCSSCGELVKKQAEICPECGVRIAGGSGGSPRGRQQSSGNTQKDAGVALLLSAITSGWAGQIYNGQAGKGIAILVVQFINVILMFFVIGFLTFPLVWLYGCYDAYNVANKINRGEIQV